MRGGSAGTLSPAREQLVVNPQGEGLARCVSLSLEMCSLGAGQPDAHDLVARLTGYGRSARWGHAAENIRPRNSLTTAAITGHNIAMTTNEAKALGAQAYETNGPMAPALNAEMMAAVARMPVGGGAADLFRAYAQGWEEAANAAALIALAALSVPAVTK